MTWIKCLSYIRNNLSHFIIDHKAREIMYLVASVRPSVRLQTLYNQSAYADNCAEAVDRLLFGLKTTNVLL